jgi:hypothetical protein
MEAEINEIKIVPFGKQLIGLTDTDMDNELDPTVKKVKEMCAEMAELLKENYANERSAVKSILFDHAIGEILNAQMSVVKMLTFKI